MTPQGLGLVALAAILTAVANLLLRGGMLRYGTFHLTSDRLFSDLLGLAAEPVFLLGVLFYGLAAIVWFAVLSVENLSTSYPVLVGMTFALVAAGAVAVFGEALSAQKLLGLFVIISGIALVARA